MTPKTSNATPKTIATRKICSAALCRKEKIAQKVRIQNLSTYAFQARRQSVSTALFSAREQVVSIQPELTRGGLPPAGQPEHFCLSELNNDLYWL